MYIQLPKITGLKRIHKGLVRITSTNPIERQNPLGLTPLTGFILLGTAVATLGVASQAGLLDALANLISKLFILCGYISIYPSIKLGH